MSIARRNCDEFTKTKAGSLELEFLSLRTQMQLYLTKCFQLSSASQTDDSTSATEHRNRITVVDMITHVAHSLVHS